MRSGLYLEDFSGENTSDMVGKVENSFPQCVNQLIGSVSLPLTFGFLFLSPR